MSATRHRRQKMKEAGPSGRDRRSSCRYPVVLQGSHLRWESRGVAHEAPVALVNISMHGCLLKMRPGPKHEPGLTVWLHSPAEESGEGIEGALISSSRTLLGTRYIRIRFLRSLSFDTFKKLVYGPDRFGDEPETLEEHHWDIYWR